MRYGIFADVHSNLDALEAVIHAYKKGAIDKYLCAGDVVGYGANPKECVEQVKMLTMVTVAGNHDWASVNLFATDYFNLFAREAVSWTAHNLDEQSRYFLEHLGLIYKNEDLTMVHGTLDDPQDFNYLTGDYIVAKTFALLKTNTCFVGHTHVAEIFIQDKDNRIYYQGGNHIVIKEENKYIINVGSVGQPRDGNPQAAYCIYDTDTKIVQIKRINYDIQTARKKIIARGLPRFLGERLLVGR
jgi:predicted phosphodiesterase